MAGTEEKVAAATTRIATAGASAGLASPCTVCGTTVVSDVTFVLSRQEGAGSVVSPEAKAVEPVRNHIRAG